MACSRTYEGECGDQSPTAEVIVVGRELWSSRGDDHWRPAQIQPGPVELPERKASSKRCSAARMHAVRSSSVRISLAVAAVALLGLATAATASAFKEFQSPSKNIGCVMSEESVRCDIRDHSWPTPPKPKNCELDYGGGVAVDTSGKAQLICAGDTALGVGPVLSYGSAITKGRFRCFSGENGVRCVNRRNHHGFVLSKQSYKLF